jgi:glycosyltransferase involved in cell wall biosynthesis
MACKVPTIATRVGGVSELIEDGVTGRLFAVGDVAAMAAGALELLADDARLTAMGESGRRAAQDRYCASRIIPVYEQYYERVLARAEV